MLIIAAQDAYPLVDLGVAQIAVPVGIESVEHRLPLRLLGQLCGEFI